MPIANIEAIIFETQQCYADALDLTETCANFNIGDINDTIKISTQRRRLEAHPHHALVRTVALQAGMLANIAVDLAEAGGLPAPSDTVAEWRQQAAQAIDWAEKQLMGRPL